MDSISISDVQHLAQLSNLSLSHDEAESLRTDLDKILKYIESLKELDTDGIEPTYQVTDLQNVYRDDEVIESGVEKSDLLKLAPDSNGDSIIVPKVL